MCIRDRCKTLTSIDLSPFSNTTKLNDWFIYGCSGLTSVDLSPLSLLRELPQYFMLHCSSLETIDLSPLSNITGVGHHLSLIHISEPTRLLSISYAVFCLKKKKIRLSD
eukprot:TRINITY_DN28406_c0_g1_i1.p1 TRINITY_DN28406_c0_g1~~TRINITY_DN28406_c0_g1_i1.p1  ORF type:complete len:109 (-),score=22.90 TRINITY_DN28406_c0_g1_i1:10-336(-)